jgi:hypothetical protein
MSASRLRNIVSVGYTGERLDTYQGMREIERVRIWEKSGD